MFHKIVVPKISQNLQENACVAVSFFKKVGVLQPKLRVSNLQLFQKIDSGTGDFLWLLQNI